MAALKIAVLHENKRKNGSMPVYAKITQNRDRAYFWCASTWSEHDMLRKVETYAKVHFDGKYKDVYTTPTSAQRLAFDIFEILYTFKDKDSTPKSNEE
ncbi:MAG: hypothetical protein LBK18_08910 [Prevotellaceae bacterium]|jgi:hypothetical protein|nr:hypothetical protein [Prevotellaceae bacterium]